MQHILRIILDTLFPPTPHGRLLSKTTEELFTQLYSEERAYGTVTLSHYHAPHIQAAIAACKFENNHQAARLLSTLLPIWLQAHPSTGVTVLLPIPLSRKRTTERGFNQVERVLHNCHLVDNCRLETTWLERCIDTKRQTSQNRTDRLVNMNNAFAVTRAVQHVDWNNITRVIICDDVVTTGATLSAARSALGPHLPTHVTLITLAWAH